jgi:ribonuclease D
LAAFCQELSTASFVTVDTEFMREKTFWPRLCLVQLGGPDGAAAVDTLVEDLDLTPLFDLMVNPDVIKVFHAARQDIEIFLHLSDRIPAPLFDTQVAAMVCGFGEAAAYETLVSKLARARVDKTSRFTDWSRRPLTDRQIQYAIGDVTHLRVIYEKLSAQLEQNGRSGWLDEEMAVLTNPKTYRLHPEDAWNRLKTRNAKPRMLGVLREVAAWREYVAQTRDVPRNRVVRDEVLLEIAADPPETAEGLSRIRNFPRGFLNGKATDDLMEAIERGRNVKKEDLPTREKMPPLPRGIGPLVDLLKVLLKAKCEQNDVAQKLVATTADLERIAVGDDDEVAAMRGWRREVFGNDAVALRSGKLALAAGNGQVTFVPIGNQTG